MEHIGQTGQWAVRPPRTHSALPQILHIARTKLVYTTTNSRSKMCLSTGIIFVLLGSSLASAFSSDDLPLAVAHRLVLQAIEQQSPTSPMPSPLTRNLGHADKKDRSCSICYDGNDPYYPNRRLQLQMDDASGLFYDSGQAIADNEASPATNALLTCVEYESAFLSKLFPEESSCRAFQGSVADICGCARPPSLCTLCDFGLAPPQPDNEIPAGMVENTDPITCLDFDRSFSSFFSSRSFLENDAKCDAVRSVGKMYCGCSEPCRFCGDGYRIGNPTHSVHDMQNLLDSIVGPFEEDEGGPTCRDVSNAAATASALFSVSADLASPLDYGIDVETAKSVNDEYICELYQSVFASECDCIKVSTHKNATHGCNICDNNEYANPNKTLHVVVDGTSIGTTCANVDTFARLGLDVCSEITKAHCPCNDTFPTIASSIVADHSDASDKSAGNAETHFDAVGVSLAVSTVIVFVASIL